MTALYIILGVLALVVVHDLTQRKHAILRNFPIIGHFRYWLEAIGPELRQYIVTDNDEERPFSRDQRRWVYASAKKENNYFGFGTDNDLELTPNYLVVKHAVFPEQQQFPGMPGYDPGHRVPCAKILGAARGRAKAFRPESIVSVSAMSFGSLSAAAVEALNRGCLESGCLHNTGEGGVSPHHRHGAGLIWQLGTGYFGARNPDGTFSMERFLDTVATGNIKAIEIKLSQGAKPGMGGLLPAAKVSAEIGRIRGVPAGRAVLSPSRHSAFGCPDELLDFVETLADATGLPVGIKSAVGQLGFWTELARLMSETDRGVDFIAIDGGEGGTGAAPLTFSDHVSLPFKVGMAAVYPIFARAGVADDIVFIGSGKLAFPEQTLLAFALGCDMVATAREAMMAIGCIQAQRCHTGHCPTGVATQNRWLARGLVAHDKGHRLANFMTVLRKETLWLARACGQPHPALVTTDDFAILDDHFGASPAREVFGYEPGWGLPAEANRSEVAALMTALAGGSEVDIQRLGESQGAP